MGSPPPGSVQGWVGATWDIGNVPALGSFRIFSIPKHPRIPWAGSGGILGINPSLAPGIPWIPHPWKRPRIHLGSTWGSRSRPCPWDGPQGPSPPTPFHDSVVFQSFKDDVDLKQDLRCDTIDTREEYELKVRDGPTGTSGREKRGRSQIFFCLFSPLEWVENSRGFGCEGLRSLGLLGGRGKSRESAAPISGTGDGTTGNGWRCSREGFGMDFREKGRWGTGGGSRGSGHGPRNPGSVWTTLPGTGRGFGGRG